MAIKHTTAASVIVTLVADELYPTGRNIEGFAEDALRDLESVVRNEATMGVDGKLSVGFVYYPTNITFHLMPDQDGYSVFEMIAQVQQTLVAPIFLSMTIVDPGLKRKYTLTKGALLNWVQMPNANRVMQPADAELIFERCTWETYEE